MNSRTLVSVIINNLLSIDVWWKVQIQRDVASECNDGEIRYMYKFIRKTKKIRQFMDALAIHNG